MEAQISRPVTFMPLVSRRERDSGPELSQQGVMGILERVNRTLKYEFISREEPRTKAELSALCAEFRNWYNTVRPHSASEYDCPWAKLLEVAESLNAA